MLKFFKKLFKKLNKYKSSNEWLNYCNNIRKKYPILLDEMKNEKYVNSYNFVKTLSKYTKNDSIITDMGFSFTTSHQALDVKENQKFLLILVMHQWAGVCQQLLVHFYSKNLNLI